MKPQQQLIDLQTLASGDVLQLQTYQFKGKTGNKKVYIQANLHGAEIVGNAVIYELIQFLSQLKPEDIAGEILLVPFCNPLGVNQRSLFFSTGRYNPYDGNNWNRIFWDYVDEKPDFDTFVSQNINLSKSVIQDNYRQQIISKFKQKIKQQTARGLSFSQHYRNQLHLLSLSADYVIDIHSSSIEAIDYLYCFEQRQKSADYFLLDYAILMNKYDGYAFDEAFLNPWLVLEKKFAKQRRNIVFDLESWTLELGSGMRVNENSVTKGVKGIVNYLASKNVINQVVKLPTKTTTFIPKNTVKSYYASTGGIIRNRLGAGTKVKHGDILCQILSFGKNNSQPEVIEIESINRGIIYDVSINDTVNQGEYILGIFPYV